ncbi:hypothetical protein RF11_00890 [Thelohanellus kitauei]|uniref:Uncharacterized protein n=1 Tax=Thelohanellus kitauei TaxID=669202 RepID=A0A0C2ISU9_THEKT|nr:hypothetical protein RF11_00890 [Thelohanellus kitauei]
MFPLFKHKLNSKTFSRSMLSFVHVLLISSLFEISFAPFEAVLTAFKNLFGRHKDVGYSKLGQDMPSDDKVDYFPIPKDMRLDHFMKLIDLAVNNMFHKRACAGLVNEISERGFRVHTKFPIPDDFKCRDLKLKKIDSLDTAHPNLPVCLYYMPTVHECGRSQILALTFIADFNERDLDGRKELFLQMLKSISPYEADYLMNVLCVGRWMYLENGGQTGGDFDRLLSFYDGVVVEDDSDDDEPQAEGKGRTAQLSENTTFHFRGLKTFIIIDL